MLYCLGHTQLLTGSTFTPARMYGDLRITTYFHLQLIFLLLLLLLLIVRRRRKIFKTTDEIIYFLFKK